MVSGLDTFKEKFADFEDCYTIIGGAACDILMSEADFDFRLTKDIDMILILEDKKVEFAKTFWSFIKEGEYLVFTTNHLSEWLIFSDYMLSFSYLEDDEYVRQ